MTEVDVVEGLLGDDEHDKSKEEPCTSSMPVELVRICDIAEGERVELRLTTSTVVVYTEQEDPGYDGTNKTDVCEHTEVANEEVVVECLVVQDKLIRQLSEGRDPVEHAKCRLGCFLAALVSVLTLNRMDQRFSYASSNEFKNVLGA